MLALSRSLVAALAVTTLMVAPAAQAEITRSLNLNGAPGLIDMPSGEAMEDAAFSFSMANIGPITRGTFSFQFSERFSASFRFNTWRDWNTLFPMEDDRESVRSIDLRYQILKESNVLPAVTIGLIDMTGQGLMASEYIAATKTFGDRLKITAGLGWGRMGTQGGIGQPFGARPALMPGDLGRPNIDQWFRGEAAAFGGVEYALTDRWTVKAEYSSDAYLLEDEERGLLDHNSPWNFGLEYHRGPNLRFGVYSLYSSELGFALHLTLDPKTRATGGITGAAPVPVKARPARAVDPDLYDQGWVTQADAGPILRKNLAKRLATDSIAVENLAVTAQRAQIRVRIGGDSAAQAIGRTARALSHVMPASVEVFEIVPVVNGIGVSKVTIRRSDLEALEFAPDNATALRDRVVISDAGPVPANALGDEGLYPKFRWALRPALRLSEPLRGDVGGRLSAAWDVSPGLVLSGSVYGRVLGNAGDSDPSGSLLPPVRSDGSRYITNSNLALERLTFAWFARPGEDLYSRVTLGYLEQMHGGISAELLWKPVNSNLSLGVEVNYTRQRDTDGGFGFGEYDYDAVTGHVSAYYDFGNGYLGQLDVGRYLAGDVGATLSIDRVFANGWRVGAYASVTNASDAEVGEGGYDKGVRIVIPLNWAFGNQARNNIDLALRPGNTDAGARLSVDGRLYNQVREYHSGGLNPDWARVWR